MYLKLSEPDRKLIDEISALSGVSKDVIREVWEYMIIRWSEQISRDPEKGHTVEIPFLGSVFVKYVGDKETPEGYVETQVESYIALSSQFKKLIGDIVDERDSVITGLLRSKIESSLIALISSKN